MTPLTEKQKAFYTNLYTPGSKTFGNGAESAKKAGYKGNGNTLAQIAHKMVINGKAKGEKARIQAESAEKTEYTMIEAQNRLDSAFTIAETQNNPAAMVSSVIAANRMYGYDKDNDVSSDQQRELTEAQAIEAKRLAELMNRESLRLA